MYLHKESPLMPSIHGVRTSNAFLPSPAWHRLYHPMEYWHSSREDNRNCHSSRWTHQSIWMKVLVLRSHAPSQSKHRRPFYSTRYKTKSQLLGPFRQGSEFFRVLPERPEKIYMRLRNWLSLFIGGYSIEGPNSSTRTKKNVTTK